MAWYEAHQTLAKHPKTLKLASLIKCERRYAVGLLHDLFTWGLDAAKKDGSLPNLNADEIASALDFSGKKGASVIAALVESGYLEKDEKGYKIHDWYDYAGKFADKREDDKQRKKEQREREKNKEDHRKSHGSHTDVTRTNSGNPLVTVPNLTVPKEVVVSDVIARERDDETEEPPNDLGRVMTFYQNRINTAPSPMCLDLLKSYTESLGADVVIRACEIAIDERKTNWSYIKGILQNCERMGIHSLADFQRADEDRRKRLEDKGTSKAPTRRMSKTEEFVAAGRNHQHTAAEMDKLMGDLDKL